ncbi:MAG: phage baseplate assembly protein V, partial [Treponema sp.]|nr:phage baseplate assembly protein V [Treponema sp.]
MIHIREELEELLKKYPDPEEGEAGIAAFRRNKETMAALPRFAVVTDNRDPLGLGRVRATCDSLASGALTGWLPVAGAGRGEDGSGFWQVPDPGDQALLVFPGGEADSPIVLGGVFGEAAKPPEIRTDKAEESFVWQTKNHRVEIRDTREGESLVISTGDGSMRYSAFADGNAELVNELGDIELSCKKL